MDEEKARSHLIEDGDWTGDFSVLYTIPAAMLIDMANPLAANIWGCHLTLDMIVSAIEEERFHGDPVEKGEADPLIHAARIAHLAKVGWPDPISVDANPNNGWLVFDGNHRLLASCFREESHIMVAAFGSGRVAERLFGEEAVAKWLASLPDDGIDL